MSPRLKPLSAAAILLTACGAFAAIIPDHHDRFLRNGEKTVLVWRGAGSLKVTKPCTVEVLLVGGGGGGGGYKQSSDTSYTMGGGGAGGFVHREALQLEAGDYTVSVGAGGAVGESGGDTAAFGLTAYGGGNGGWFLRNTKAPGTGGSGGGATMNWSQSGVVIGGRTTDPAQGNIGGSTDSPYGGAGGGGAGAPGADQVGGGASAGGDGLPCSITGQEVWYAGGGGGYRMNTGAAGAGGKGGGGKGNQAGTDGLGGGGGGNAKGGGGVAILSFIAEAEDDSDDFSLSGGDVVPVIGAMGSLHVFKADDVLTVTGTGAVDILMVGGGGGGGPSFTQGDGQVVGGAGGGAGGFVYYTNVTVTAGTYAVKVGQGGAVGANGGDSMIVSTLIPIVAHGGGAGAGGKMSVAPTKPGNGGSGGGAADNGAQAGAVRAGGLAAYLDEGNLGHNGGNASNYWAPAGGGGAGAPGADSNGLVSPALPGGGGEGLPCRITGEEIWYAGGGAGYRPNTPAVSGGKGGGGTSNVGGADGLGGGGGGGASGGSGIVIVRCRKPIPAERAFRDATGGQVTNRGGYRIHTFTEDGEFSIPHNGYVEVLVVGGGGGGGDVASQHAGDMSQTTGGGGAGGFVHRGEMIVTGGVYRITVGAGGEVGMNGGDSRAFDIVAYGGGNGGWFQRAKGAGAGGSGGGAVMSYTESLKTPLVPSPGGLATAVMLAQGHGGGSSWGIYKGAGGGGAGAPGGDGENGCAVGGDGLPCSITGEEVWYAGGGAGYRPYVDLVSGGKGGGGKGRQPGVNGLGGGGGGSAKGGSGVVIIRYRKSEIGMTLLVR